MITLSLLRHAKANWDDPALKDFDRPLSRRGETAAPRMGAYMAAQRLAPDSSDATALRQLLNDLIPIKNKTFKTSLRQMTRVAPGFQLFSLTLIV